MCQGIRSLLRIQIGIADDFTSVSEEIVSEELAAFFQEVDLDLGVGSAILNILEGTRLRLG